MGHIPFTSGPSNPNYKHGKTETPEWLAFKNMHDRCSNPNHEAYKNYGGRGINVCEQWNDFKQFWKDMGDRPSDDHSLERIDNDEGYYPENCRWATRKEQCRNRRNSFFLEVNGERLTIPEWSEKTGINITTLWFRVKQGWTPEDIVSIQPWSKHKRSIKH